MILMLPDPPALCHCPIDRTGIAGGQSKSQHHNLEGKLFAMNVSNNYGRTNTNKVGYLPRPLRQGHLDRLCGVYAIINACRHVCASPEINKRLGRWELFSVLADALEKRGKLATVICYGKSVKDYNHLLALAVKFMLGEHGLVLKIKRPLKRIKAPRLTKVFNLVSHHLEHPRTSAILEFEAMGIGQ